MASPPALAGARPPPPPPDRRIDAATLELERPRPLRALAPALRRPLTVVTGYPGSGKTVLIRQWLAGVEARASYASLRPADAAPSRFWRAVLDATADLGGAVARPSAARSAADARMAALTALQSIDEDAVLVLDHLHHAGRTIARSAVEIVDVLPPGVHVVLVTRSPAGLPLSAVRVRGDLLELGDDELRFDREEITALLTDASSSEADPATVTAIQQRTEGWAVGVAVAAAAAAHRVDIVAAFDEATTPDRGVLAAMIEELVAAEPREVQDFLNSTAILNRLTPSLCDALTGRDDSAALLRHLEDANLFVIPLDEQRCWSRYHRLFADVLRARLRLGDRARERRLHTAAIGWLTARGDLVEVARHRLATGARDAAFAALTTHADACLDSGCVTRSALPTSAFGRGYLEHSADRMAAWASLLLAQGRREDAREWLRRAESAAPADDPSVALRIARGWCVYREMGGDTRETLEAAQRMRAAAIAVGGGPALVRAAVATVRALTWSGQTRAARDAVASAAAIDATRPRPRLALLSSALSQVACAEGRLHEAEELAAVALEARDDALEGDWVPIDAWLTRGEVLLERNLLDAAADALELARGAAERCSHQAFVTLAQIRLASVLFAVGLSEAAFGRLRAARGIRRSGSRNDPQGRQADAVESRLRALSGEFDRADQLIATLVEGPASALLAARVAIGRGQFDAARSWLERADSAPRSLRQEIEAAVLAALVHVHDDVRIAEADLRRAVDLARPEGYVRLFVDEGKPLARLLRRLGASDPSTYLRRMISATEDRKGRYESGNEPSAAQQLSEREIAVLAYLPTRLSYQQIGDGLFISLNTVKTHTKGIYRKLGVSTRAEAVARARAAGLL